MATSTLHLVALALLGLTFVPSAARASGGTTQGPHPVKLTTTQVPPAHRGGPPLIKTMVRNVSDKCIIGLVVGFKFFDTKGRPVMSMTKLDVAGKPLYCYEPEQKWLVGNKNPVPVSVLGRPVTYKATVDLVVFKDGKRWGPQKLTAFDNQLLGMITMLQGEHPSAR